MRSFSRVRYAVDPSVTKFKGTGVWSFVEMDKEEKANAAESSKEQKKASEKTNGIAPKEKK